MSWVTIVTASRPTTRRWLLNLKQCFLCAGLLLALGSGCATRNVNPPQTRANTGYVDFHTDGPNDLMWEVSWFDPRLGEYQPLFHKFAPLEDPVLRLAFAPGRKRFRVSFLNRVIEGPSDIELLVQDGKITPVLISLVDAGTAMVKTKETSVGGTAYGRYGRRTKFSTSETRSYRLSAVAGQPIPYQTKEQMPYWRRVENPEKPAS